jgi:hypothetical protein
MGTMEENSQRLEYDVQSRLFSPTKPSEELMQEMELEPFHQTSRFQESESVQPPG